MTAYLEAPNTDTRPYRMRVFLAGGITDCWDWQTAIIGELADLPDDVLLMNPRRANFPIGDPDAAPAQIAWEFAHLMAADLIAFYFTAGPSPQPIVMYEFGRYMALGKPLAVAVEDGYLRAQDVQVQAGLARPDMPIGASLDDLAAAIRRAVD